MDLKFNTINLLYCIRFTPERQQQQVLLLISETECRCQQCDASSEKKDTVLTNLLNYPSKLYSMHTKTHYSCNFIIPPTHILLTNYIHNDRHLEITMCCASLFILRASTAKNKTTTERMSKEGHILVGSITNLKTFPHSKQKQLLNRAVTLQRAGQLKLSIT